MLQCTAVHLVGGTGHEHIAEIQCKDTSSGANSTKSRAAMVTYVDAGNYAFCQDKGGDRAYLATRTSALGTRYVQTKADGIWADNLLALPRY